MDCTKEKIKSNFNNIKKTLNLNYLFSNYNWWYFHNYEHVWKIIE